MKKIYFLFFTTVLIFTLACDNGKKELKTINLTDAKIKLYKNKIEEDPSYFGNYDKLANHYIQKARETGDIKYYVDAERTLKKSLDIKPENYTGMLLFAKTRLANHEFAQSRDYAERAVELSPENSAAYGILGDAYLELGHIKNAEKAYVRMLELNPGLDSYSRMSNLFHHKHDHDAAIEYMELAYDSGIKNPSTPKENLAWTQVMIGSVYLHSGNSDEAEKYFNRALRIFDGYYLALEHLEEIKNLR